MIKEELRKLRTLKATPKMIEVARNDKKERRRVRCTWEWEYYSSSAYEYCLYLRCQELRGYLKVAVFLPEHLRCGSNMPAYEIFIHANAANGKVKDMKAALDKAKAAEKEAKAALKKLQENPEVPADVMEKLRQEAMTAAAEDVRKEAEKQVAAAEEAARVAEEKLAAATKAAQLQNPEAAVFKSLFEQVQQDFNKMSGALQKVELKDAALGEKLRNAVMALVKEWENKLAVAEA